MVTMVEAGLGTPDGTLGKAYVLARYDVATHAVDQQMASGQEIDVQSLLTIMSGVTDDPATIIAANATIDDAVIIVSSSVAHDAHASIQPVNLVGVQQAAHNDAMMA